MQRKSVVLATVLLFVLLPKVPAQDTMVAVIAVYPPQELAMPRVDPQDALITATFDRIVALADDKHFLVAPFDQRAARVRGEVERYAALAVAADPDHVQPQDVRNAFDKLGPHAKTYLIGSGAVSDENRALMKLNTHFSLYFFWEMYNGRERAQDGMMVRN